MKKKVFYTELAYVLGIVFLDIGSAMMERAGFGLSMVVAPAYLLHLKLSQTLPFFSFGMAEYCLQGMLLVLLSFCMGKFRPMYLFSFVSAVLYGLGLDVSIKLVALIPGSGMALRLSLFFVGMLLCCLGVVLCIKTYIAPLAYELFAKEITRKTGKPFSRVKTIYDCTSCLTAVLLSFLFFGFGHFVGVNFGTAFCALTNGRIVGVISSAMDARYDYRDGLKLRKYFE